MPTLREQEEQAAAEAAAGGGQPAAALAPEEWQVYDEGAPCLARCATKRVVQLEPDAFRAALDLAVLEPPAATSTNGAWLSLRAPRAHVARADSHTANLCGHAAERERVVNIVSALPSRQQAAGSRPIPAVILARNLIETVREQLGAAEPREWREMQAAAAVPAGSGCILLSCQLSLPGQADVAAVGRFVLNATVNEGGRVTIETSARLVAGLVVILEAFMLLPS